MTIESAAEPEVSEPARTTRPWFVGAYAAMPKGEWRVADERLILNECRAAARDAAPIGWEVPFSGSLHPHDEAWFLGELQPRDELVVTLLPGVVVRLASDADFGLASPDAAGRRRAIEFTRTALAAVRRANDNLGRRVVRAVELHSAPGGGRASAAALRDSLAEIGEWNWGGAELLIEHCDAHVPGRPSAKGYLSFDDELDVIADLNASGHRYGMLVNWARSAIEARSTSRPLEHISSALMAGLLRGFMYSGCTDRPDGRGGAWADFHLPPGGADARQHSLLDAPAIAATRAALGDPGDLAVFGMKVGAAATDTLGQRLAIIRRSTQLLHSAG
jgi:hypothetical protein